MAAYLLVNIEVLYKNILFIKTKNLQIFVINPVLKA